MPKPSPSSWTFDRSWGDPLIATLLLLSFFLASQVLARHLAPAPTLDRVSLAARLAEPSLMAPQILRFRERTFLNPTRWDRAWNQFQDPWDRALVAVLATEQGSQSLWDLLPPSGPGAIGKALHHAYEGGPPLSSQERAWVLEGLGPTYAGRLLESRLMDREGRPGAPERRKALETLVRKSWTLAGLSLLLGLGGVGGAGFALFLFLTRRRPNLLIPTWPLEWRTMGLIFLAWFCALLLSGSLISRLVHPLPEPWKVLGLPLAYTLHAAFGLWLIQGFSGIRWAKWLQPLHPGFWGRAMAWALGFAGLAVAAVFCVGILVSLLVDKGQPPQKELLEALAAVRGLPATCLLFLTVAVLAPAFEEIFFRGFLLPWMAARWGRIWALLGTSLLFAAIHLVPSGLPALSALGLVLGVAYLRTADIRVCILVHGAWNGAVFLFTRWALG